MDMSYRNRYILAAYSVTNGVTLLDIMDLEGDANEPRVDRHSGQVYIPCKSHGVCVVRYDGCKLVPVRTLKCVGRAYTLAVVSSDILYVCDLDRETVFLVNVTQDRITARLEEPREVKGARPKNVPCRVAVLGDTLVVVYTGPRLVTYQHSVPTPGKLLPLAPGTGHCVWSKH